MRGRVSITFESSTEFEAVDMCERALRLSGFSFADRRRNAPRGVLFGNEHIGRWRYLTKEERAGLHGVISGDERRGPIVIEIFAGCPGAGVEAMLHRVLGGQ